VAIVTLGPPRENAAAVTDRDLEPHLAEGLRLARSGAYFEAHEAFELAWRRAGAEERDFFKGLVHVVVAWYQAGRGNRVGCERQLEKARRRLAPFEPMHRRVDVGALLRQVDAARAVVEGESLALPRLSV
jgi:uncharacterized protein